MSKEQARSPRSYENDLYQLAFVDRDDARRIISLRKANRREVKHYVQSF